MPQPPKYLLQFFRWFCHPDYAEDIEGDLHEKYEHYSLSHSKRKADWLFFWSVLSLFRPSLMRPISIFKNLNHLFMLRQNLKIGYRNLLKDKGYSAIKIGGFAIGIAAFLLILLFVQNELSYDQHYQNGDRIYRLLHNSTNPEYQIKRWTNFQAPVGKLLKEEYPEIEKVGRLIIRDWYLAGDNQFRRSDQKQNNYEDGFAYADPELLDIFEIPMVYGTQKDALSSPYSIVLSKSKAEKYFPGENPVGKTIVLNDYSKQPFTVGGVMKDFPPTSTLDFNFLITLTDVEFWDGEQTSWCCNNYEAYIQVKPDTDISALEQKLLAIRDNYMIPYHVNQKTHYDEILKKHRTFSLQPMGDIYLSSDVGDDFKHSSFNIVHLFGVIAVFILLLACINFINLFTAKSANRAKEVGVRKVVGSFRSDLIKQFLSESILYSSISVILGAMLASIILPYFNQLSGKNLELPLTVWWLAPALAGLAFLIGLLAGAYPAFYLSTFKPINVLKGNLSLGAKNSSLRNGMVIFQFTISIILVVSALVVYSQMQFILNKEVGFDKEKMLLIRGAGTLGEKTDAFKAELQRLPMVKGVTNSSYLPIAGTLRNGNSFTIEGRQQIDKGVGGQAWWVADNYIPTMKINLLKGRNFSSEMAGDTATCIINQKMAEKLGLDNPVGSQIRNWRAWNVIGVVEDFHFEDMKWEIRPLVMFRGRGAAAIVVAKLKGGDLNKSIAAVNDVWDQFMPNQPLRYSFMDEDYAGMYQEVNRTKNVFATCAGLAILIACLGLLGLSTFMAEQRSKEISIRKVLGASIGNLFGLLTANYLKLIGISLVIGIPISWYLMQNWLEDYTYRIPIVWWFFVGAGAVVAVIALLTVSQQALKLAFSNPTQFLKGE
ncbi:MAG: ABC transporter permease [Bacteroidota bacterium]